ncbi:DUF1259 domain-containing protein [Chengkuizengella sp. SCS-71B]|uniref:DUF1259 domain-containing protein n=1 Tax=Chengkuizengella sp. SCS-71B TaxID=3115290 RepID=UPI0032C23404
MNTNQNFNQICKAFAEVLGGEPTIKNGVCTVILSRDIATTIQGVRSQSLLLYPADFSFEALTEDGEALNLGAIGLLQGEVTPFIKEILKDENMELGTLSNHWLYEDPRILYTHFQSIQPPLDFAETVSRAFKTLQIQNFMTC